jgi:hypothetical protein
MKKLFPIQFSIKFDLIKNRNIIFLIIFFILNFLFIFYLGNQAYINFATQDDYKLREANTLIGGDWIQPKIENNNIATCILLLFAFDVFLFLCYLAFIFILKKKNLLIKKTNIPTGEPTIETENKTFYYSGLIFNLFFFSSVLIIIYINFYKQIFGYTFPELPRGLNDISFLELTFFIYLLFFYIFIIIYWLKNKKLSLIKNLLLINFLIICLNFILYIDTEKIGYSICIFCEEYYSINSQILGLIIYTILLDSIILFINGVVLFKFDKKRSKKILLFSLLSFLIYLFVCGIVEGMRNYFYHHLSA